MKHGPEIRSPGGNRDGGNRDGGWSFCRIASHARGSRGLQRAVAERGWGYRTESLIESGAMSTTKSSVVYIYAGGDAICFNWMEKVLSIGIKTWILF